MCNFGNGNGCCSWIILLIIVLCCCGGNNGGCGCESPIRLIAEDVLI